MTALPQFRTQAFLTTALTHRSALNEHLSSSPESNERMEFLGDAVLELLTTKYLYDHYPQEPEGVLTAYRSALVKTTTLAEVATEFDLGNRLFMSKGEEASSGRNNTSLLANAFEALLGALYLDQGLDAADKLLQKHLLPRLDEIVQKKLFKDSKSKLQEESQAHGYDTPDYVVVGESGPDHDRVFTVHAFIKKQQLGEGTGRSKQLAQQAAAQDVLDHPERWPWK